jgi:dTDP-4-dehydrorhamnose 3,5-epimerase-like enzyme
MIYKTSTLHDVESDTGILWNSLDIPWPTNNPIISERDKQFISFEDFKSPFLFQDL